MADQKYEIRELVDFLPKVGVVFLTACYVFGFVIVNVHLAGFGITDLEVIKSKYIAAGLLYLFFMTLTVGVPFYIILRWREKEYKSRGIAFFAAGFLMYFTFPLIMMGEPFADRSTLLRYFCFTLLNSYFFVSILLEDFPFTPSQLRSFFFPRILQILLILFFSSTAFAKYVYPGICTHYGGGRLLQVRLMYNDEKLSRPLCCILSTLPIETNLVSQDTETITLYMALDGNREIYDATVSLPRIAAKSIIFLGESPRASLRFKPRRDKNIYQIAQIFADVYDNTENPKQEEVLKNKLKNINLNDNEIDFFVNLFRKLATEVQKSL